MLLNRLSEYIARQRGLLPLLGVLLILLNFVVQFIPGLEGLSRYNVLLHLGLVVGLVGMLLSDALG